MERLKILPDNQALAATPSVQPEGKILVARAPLTHYFTLSLSHYLLRQLTVSHTNLHFATH